MGPERLVDRVEINTPEIVLTAERDGGRALSDLHGKWHTREEITFHLDQSMTELYMM